MEDDKIKIYTFANDVTNLCSDLPEWVESVWGLYAFRSGERTYVCSMSPSSYCHAFSDVVVCNEDHPDYSEYKRDELEQEIAYSRESHYFNFLDTEKDDPRIAFHAEWNMSELDEDDQKLVEDGEWYNVDEIREDYFGNHTHPKVLMDAQPIDITVFDAIDYIVIGGGYENYKKPLCYSRKGTW